jgi:hypothetical protein
LSFPGCLRRDLEKSLRQTRFLHLGYEEPHGKPVCKLYCEAAPADGARVRMHTGFKWRPTDPDEYSCDEYWRLGGLDERKLREHIARTLEPNKDLAGAAQRLLDKVLARVPAADLFYMEVMRGMLKRSFDLRLYDAGLTLGDVADVARDAAQVLGAEPVGHLVADGAAQSLGHVSAGPSFLTFYYGAEELA